MLALCGLLGCAQPLQRSNANDNFWSGRLALQVEGHAAQSFSASFELRGNPQNGALVLISPLGNRLAQLEWSDGHAQLMTSGQDVRSSNSLDSLIQDVTGTRLPVPALFQWLRGVDAQEPGWQADLSALESGRLLARRVEPAPQATLRIALTP
ncbi:lipoprotein insertase outer membrane protein LolB [Paracidovorax sp. MALMAid1276]|uniref:lipoprotein insertase outer membrane protein LolB n=1 Tax=Paracidovorax sp. MALMAid1276 TaxID=3411631 RepID=UPI003B9A73F0